MIITILYSLWIAYTAGSLSIIIALASLSWLAKKEQKRNDERIRKILRARPLDSQQ